MGVFPLPDYLLYHRKAIVSHMSISVRNDYGQVLSHSLQALHKPQLASSTKSPSSQRPPSHPPKRTDSNAEQTHTPNRRGITQ